MRDYYAVPDSFREFALTHFAQTVPHSSPPSLALS